MGTKNFEASAMTVHKNDTQPTPFTPPIDSSSRFCTHCYSTKHTVDVCWKQGYSKWYKLKQAERNNKKSTQVALTNATPLAFASQVSRLSSQKGNSCLAFISIAPNTWVIDSGAIDHMTSQSSLLDSLIPSPIKSIQVANGTSMLISGVGNASFSPTLSMSFVLLMLSLFNSLLSISKTNILIILQPSILLTMCFKIILRR